MAKLFALQDYNKNEIRNAVVHVLGSDPGSLVEAQFWYNSTAKRIKFYDGTTALSVLTSGADLAAGSVANTALATNPLARANHTGSQAASTISDLATVVKAYRLDEFAAPNVAVSFNSQRITAVGTPTAGTDAANKDYVDNAVAGLSWKNEVRVATTATGTLATSFENGDSVDGVTLVTGDRILIKDQAAGAENGIYTVNASGAPTRATDADSSAELLGSAVYVANGTTNGGTRWVLNTTGTITVGTTALTFVQFGGGSTYTAGNGLTLSGNDFNVGAGTGITVNANDVAVNTAVVARWASVLITGDGSTATFNVDHNFANQWVNVTVWEVATGEQVFPLVVASTTNRVVITFSPAPANATTWRVAVAG